MALPTIMLTVAHIFWSQRLSLGRMNKIPGPPKEPKITAQHSNIESIGSIGSIILAILEVQVHAHRGQIIPAASASQAGGPAPRRAQTIIPAMMWLFLQIRGSFCGRACNKSPTKLGP